MICTFGLGVLVLLVLQAALDAWGLGAAAALSPLVVLAAAARRVRAGDGGEVAARRPAATRRPPAVELVHLAQRAGRHVPRVVAVPWLGPATVGSPALTVWLRTLGARIGRGVWCETYWLPEADLVTLGDAATVNRGCVLQTHLFHDRVMSMDTVELGRGASLGPHGVVLPAASLDDGARVGPGVAGAARRRHPRRVALDRQPGGPGVTQPPRGPVPARPARRRPDGRPVRARARLPRRHQPARRARAWCTPGPPARSTGSRWPCTGCASPRCSSTGSGPSAGRTATAGSPSGWAGEVLAGTSLLDRGALRRAAAARARTVGRGRLGGARRRGHRRRPARRRAHLVPVPRQPGGQGEPSGHRHGGGRLRGARQRARWSRARRGPDACGGCTTSPSRWRRTWPRCRSGATSGCRRPAPRCWSRPGCAPPPSTTSPGSPR